MNGTLVPMGEYYNLIGIDVDNIENTINTFNQILESNNISLDTFTVKTMNNGFHYYFRLTDEQKIKLKDFSSFTSNKKTENLFFDRCFVDVKYNNQCLFGPSIIQNIEELPNKIYKYEIYKNNDIMILPNILFDEIIRLTNHSGDNRKNNKMTNKKTIVNEKNNKEKKDRKYVDKNVFKKLLNMISDKKWINRDTWFKLGGIIFYEIEDYDEALKIYDDWSKLYKDEDCYEENGCKDTFESLKLDPTKQSTIGTLKFWAKQDDPEAYYKLFPW